MEVGGGRDWSPSFAFEEVSADPSLAAAPLRVGSLNVLATCYCNPKQLQWLSPQRLAWDHRRESLLAALRATSCDIIALQEVDRPEDFVRVLSALGYDYEFARRPGRADGCLTAWRARRFSRVHAVGGKHHPQSGSGAGSWRTVVDFNALVSLQGHDERFRRNNIALIVALRALPASEQEGGGGGGGGGGARHDEGKLLLVANAHLYWNPAREDVKLAQAVFLARRLERLSQDLASLSSCSSSSSSSSSSFDGPQLLQCTRTERFHVLGPVPSPASSASSSASSSPSSSSRRPPPLGVVLLGDLNSTPQSAVFRFLTTSAGVDRNAYGPPYARNAEGRIDKFLCDSSLNRITRWLRLLGIDAALETAEEEAQRTANSSKSNTNHNNNNNSNKDKKGGRKGKQGKSADCSALFGRCEAEGRVLLTSSRRVLQRANCPPAVFLDNRCARESFAALVRRLRVPMDPARFLTRCVKCNGVIEPEFSDNEEEEEEEEEVEDEDEDEKEEDKKGNVKETAPAEARNDKTGECSGSGRSETKSAESSNKKGEKKKKKKRQQQRTRRWPEGWDGERARRGEGVPQDLPLYMCTNPECLQVYWFSNRPNSSAVRSKELADDLFELVKEHAKQERGAKKKEKKKGEKSKAAAAPAARPDEDDNSGNDNNDELYDAYDDDDDDDDDEEEDDENIALSAAAVPSAATRVLAGEVGRVQPTASSRPTTPATTMSSGGSNNGAAPGTVSGAGDRLRHCLGLRSAYHDDDHEARGGLSGCSDSGGLGLGDGPAITTSRADFHGYLDFVLYGGRGAFKAKCARRLALPTEASLRRAGALGELPSPSWGSDHLLVAADLLWDEGHTEDDEDATGAATAMACER